MRLVSDLLQTVVTDVSVAFHYLFSYYNYCGNTRLRACADRGPTGKFWRAGPPLVQIWPG